MNPEFRSATFLKGTYCDFFGTLLIKGKINKELVAYLNAKHAAGEKVVVFSTSCEDTVETLPTLGLHPDIAKVEDKYKYYNQKLEMVIDDNPSLLMRAEMMFDPQSPVFLSIMRDFLRNAPQKPACSAGPAPA